MVHLLQLRPHIRDKHMLVRPCDFISDEFRSEYENSPTPYREVGLLPHCLLRLSFVCVPNPWYLDVLSALEYASAYNI